jgi:hypothetical protein
VADRADNLVDPETGATAGGGEDEMNLPQPMSLEFNLIAMGFFLVIAIMPQQALNVASFGRVKQLGPKEITGWRMFAGFFALMAAIKALNQIG